MADELMAEFSGPEALAEAIRQLRERGLAVTDAHTPYSTEAVREALGQRGSPLSLLVLAGGVVGAGLAYGLEWLLVARLYPLNVGGRPPHLPLSFVPIAFEMGVLLASTAAFVGALAWGGLVKLYDPVFEQDGFESATETGFWLRLDAAATESTRAELERDIVALGARRIGYLARPS
jgi:hypothetical protein